MPCLSSSCKKRRLGLLVGQEKDLEEKTKTYYVVSCYHVGKKP